MRKKVLVAREIFPEVIERLAQHFELETNQADHIFSETELAQRLADKDGVFSTLSERISPAVLSACPNLKAVCNMAVGYNNIDVPAATAAGVMVTNTPEVLNETTADFGFALMMATARRITESEAWLRQGKWDRWRYDSFMGVDLHGATLGIIGMGRIGQAIARRSMGFGMKVIYHNRSRLEPSLEERANNARWVEKEELLKTADHVMLVVPYSPAVHHLIGAKEIALMKPTATLVNIARGGVVDDAALVAALKAGTIAGAGLDVFENEPAFHPGFLELSNVVLTPHIASSSRNTRLAMANCAADNLIAALSGQRPPNLLNPAAHAPA